MREETSEQAKPLRFGYTTGSCATATALAAATLLLTGRVSRDVTITLPRGQQVGFELQRCRPLGNGVAEAATIKDAGDDPDVTHAAVVFAQVRRLPVAGVVFVAGAGVGTVTREGLSLAVGEPAINPVPRQMINDHLQQLAVQLEYEGGFEVAVGVEGGEALALKTMNPRLGILGGLSILGTTGIVRPFSCSAYIASIHQGMDVASSNAQAHIAACTGATSEQFIRQRYGLDDMALIEMGDFIGAVLKHSHKVPFQRISLVGGFGKFSKLACGHMDLHSRRSSIDFDFLAELAASIGAGADLLAAIKEANTSLQALALCRAQGMDLARPLAQAAWRVARAKIPVTTTMDIFLINKKGELLAGYDGENFDRLDTGALCP